ncbi:transposable element Tcb2 transposase [Trichonephila clavipes]|nr:transposable element Tcb2 transposase [Trichonephila clavipes]
MGFGSRRPTSVPLFNARHWASRLAWARERRDWSVEDWKRVTWSDECPVLNPIEHLWDVLEQSVKGHHTEPKNLTEFWTALANIWQFIPVERFQKLVESMVRRVAVIIKARGGPTRY